MRRGKTGKEISHAPTDSFKKSNSNVSHRAMLLWTLVKSGSSHSAARRGISRGQYGRRAKRPFKPHHRRIQYSTWLGFAQEPYHRQLLHWSWRWNTRAQHRGSEHGGWHGSAFSLIRRRP